MSPATLSSVHLISYLVVPLRPLENQQGVRELEVTCPPLFPPRHGYLECTRNTVDSPDGPRRRVTNHVGTVCVLKCPLGYEAVGAYARICSSQGNWTGHETGTCRPLSTLTCPQSVRRELGPKERSTTIFRVTPPKDLKEPVIAPGEKDLRIEWRVEPLGVNKEYGRPNDEVELSVGKYTFTYKAGGGSGSKRKSSCQFTVEILAPSPPEVLSCPMEQTVTVGSQYETAQVDWSPPVFVDNVAVTSVTSSHLSGSQFGLGSHKVSYTASDAAGHTAKCVFRIVVRLPKWKYSQYLQLPRDI